jgi:hypothetical protein
MKCIKPGKSIDTRIEEPSADKRSGRVGIDRERYDSDHWGNNAKQDRKVEILSPNSGQEKVEKTRPDCAKLGERA